MAHRASNEHRIFAMSGIVISAVKYSSSIVVIRWEATEKSNEAGLVIKLWRSKLITLPAS